MVWRLSHRFAANGRRDSRCGGDDDVRRRLLFVLVGALGQIDNHLLVFGGRRFELKNARAQKRVFFDLKHSKQAKVE